MRALHFITLFFAASGCAALGGEATNRVDAFSTLKQGDSLVVSFHSSACFTWSTTHEFTFHRASELMVSVERLQFSRATNRTGVVTTQTNRVALGTLTLSKSDIAGLDKLMDYYRTKHNIFSTAIDEMTLTQQRDGKIVATEEITDATGQTHSFESLTRFPDLIARLRSSR